MILQAEEVLRDCREALDDFVDGLQGRRWRRHWILCLTLVRCVGHVLKEVDRKSDGTLRSIVDIEYQELEQRKPEPRIFWEFIKKERDSILKQYRTSAGQGVTIDLEENKTTYDYVINEGVFKGYEERELLKQAINFWEQHIANIKKKYEQWGK